MPREYNAIMAIIWLSIPQIPAMGTLNLRPFHPLRVEVLNPFSAV